MSAGAGSGRRGHAARAEQESKRARHTHTHTHTHTDATMERIDATGMAALQFLGVSSREAVSLVVPAVLIVVVLLGYCIERAQLASSHSCWPRERERERERQAERGAQFHVSRLSGSLCACICRDDFEG